MKKTLFTFLFALLFYAQANAQLNDRLVVLFESPPGVLPARIFTDGFESGDIIRWDANSDGVRDLISVEVDDQDNPVGINAIDVQTQTLISHVHVPEEFPVLFRGFGTFVPGDFPVVNFGNEGVVLVDQTTDEIVFRLDPTHRLVRFTDMNDDGLTNLVIHNTQAQTVQIWGVSEN